MANNMKIPSDEQVRIKAEELAKVLYPRTYSECWVQRCIPAAELIISWEHIAYIEGFNHGLKKVDEYRIENGENLS